MAWIASLPACVVNMLKIGWSMRPKCLAQARSSKGRPYLGSQNTVQVASGSGAHETSGHEAPQNLRNLWEIAIANGDFYNVVCLIRMRMS